MASGNARYLYFLFVLLLACSRSDSHVEHSAGISTEDRLDTIRDLEKSVLKIVCTAYYDNYFYNQPASFTASIPQQKLQSEENYTSSSVAATGLLLHQDSNQAMLLSCYHVFDFPDTIRCYYSDANNQVTGYLSSLSIRASMSILVFHRNGRSTRAELIYKDEDKDVGLVITEPATIALTEVPFPGTFLVQDNLKFGEEIYMIGFPKGFMMITRGLVSPSPNKNKFMVDASFNQGFSGGIAFRFNEITHDPEYVGMANSVSYTSEHVLVPSPAIANPTKLLDVPYDDKIYVKELKLINYGVTFVLKSNEIVDVIKNSMEMIRSKGLYFHLRETK
jgi:hypothetical protein